jgi:group I intron endonuclease
MAEPKKIGIYKLTSPDGKVYIGQSTDLKTRRSHFFGSEHTFLMQYKGLVEAVKVYPREQWKHEVLCTCPKSALDVCERFYIDTYKSINPKYGYNRESGGKKGYRVSEETARKISKSKTGKCIGEDNGMFGKKHSEEAKKKMGENHAYFYGAEHSSSKAVNQYDKAGNFIKRWESIMDVERELGISHSHISTCCKGKRKSAGGYCWLYA